MKAAVMYGARDVRFEDRDAPRIIEATDAVVRTSVTCICGSDLWTYRGVNEVKAPMPFGHEYCGIVEEVGRAVTKVKPGQFVIGSFFASDNSCPHCQVATGYRAIDERRAIKTLLRPAWAVCLKSSTLFPLHLLDVRRL